MKTLTFATLAELEENVTIAPAIAYVRETGSYYVSHKIVPWLLTTEGYSGLGEGNWHPADLSSPKYDRTIHLCETRCFNGWDLDYFPKYASELQKPPTMGEFLLFGGKMFGHADTTVADVKPGDLIYRLQTWEGIVTEVHDHYVGLSGIEGEVSSKYFSAKGRPLAEGQVAAYHSLATITLTTEDSVMTCEIVDHTPNGRNAVPTKWQETTDKEHGVATSFNCLEQLNPLVDSIWDDAWRPAGENTTGVFVREFIAEEDREALIGATVTIVCNHWYMVSKERLYREEDHRPYCWEYHYLATGDAPARFDRVLVTQEDLFQDPKLLTGDLVYATNSVCWYQLLDDAFANLTRILTSNDVEEAVEAIVGYSLDDLVVLLRESRAGDSYTKRKVRHVSDLGDVSYRQTSSLNYPPEVLYVKG